MGRVLDLLLIQQGLKHYLIATSTTMEACISRPITFLSNDVQPDSTQAGAAKPIRNAHARSRCLASKCVNRRVSTTESERVLGQRHRDRSLRG